MIKALSKGSEKETRKKRERKIKRKLLNVRERTRKSKDDGRRKKEGVEDFEEREKVISMEGVLTRRKEGRE